MDEPTKLRLLQAIESHKETILSKSYTVPARKLKSQAWNDIRTRVVSECKREFSVEQLVKKWGNIQFQMKAKQREVCEGGIVNLNEAEKYCLKILTEGEGEYNNRIFAEVVDDIESDYRSATMLSATAMQMDGRLSDYHPYQSRTSTIMKESEMDEMCGGLPEPNVVSNIADKMNEKIDTKPVDLTVQENNIIIPDTTAMDQNTKLTLLRAIDEHKEKILCKSYTVPARKIRNEAWQEIRTKVMTECKREYSVEQLIKKFKNIQFSIRSKQREVGEGGTVNLNTAEEYCARILSYSESDYVRATMLADSNISDKIKQTVIERTEKMPMSELSLVDKTIIEQITASQPITERNTGHVISLNQPPDVSRDPSCTNSVQSCDNPTISNPSLPMESLNTGPELSNSILPIFQRKRRRVDESSSGSSADSLEDLQKKVLRKQLLLYDKQIELMDCKVRKAKKEEEEKTRHADSRETDDRSRGIKVLREVCTQTEPQIKQEQ